MIVIFLIILEFTFLFLILFMFIVFIYLYMCVYRYMWITNCWLTGWTCPFVYLCVYDELNINANMNMIAFDGILFGMGILLLRKIILTGRNATLLMSRSTRLASTAVVHIAHTAVSAVCTILFIMLFFEFNHLFSLFYHISFFLFVYYECLVYITFDLECYCLFSY